MEGQEVLDPVTTTHPGDVSPARFAGWYRDLVEEPRARLMAHRAGGERTFKIVAGALTIGAVAGGVSLANARFAAPGDDAVRVFGAPVDLTVAGLCYGLGVLGYFGTETDHVLNIGHGCLSAWAYRRMQRFARERFAVPVTLEQTQARASEPQAAVRGAFGPAPVRGGFWPYNQHAGMTPQHQSQYAWSP
jgi:hypothetical protein